MDKDFIFEYEIRIGIHADSHAEAMDIMARLSRNVDASDYTLESVYSKARDEEYRVYETGYEGIDAFIGEDK